MKGNGSNNNGFLETTKYEKVYSALIQEKKTLENRIADIDKTLALIIFSKLQNDLDMKAASKRIRSTKKKKPVTKKKKNTEKK